MSWVKIRYLQVYTHNYDHEKASHSYTQSRSLIIIRFTIVDDYHVHHEQMSESWNRMKSQVTMSQWVWFIFLVFSRGGMIHKNYSDTHPVPPGCTAYLAMRSDAWRSRCLQKTKAKDVDDDYYFYYYSSSSSSSSSYSYYYCYYCYYCHCHCHCHCSYYEYYHSYSLLGFGV